MFVFVAQLCTDMLSGVRSVSVGKCSAVSLVTANNGLFSSVQETNKCNPIFYVRHVEGLDQSCMQYEEFDDDYRMMMSFTDVPGIQPENYLVRFPFYILAESDARVIFTETADPDWLADDAYEIGK